ncbi:DUF2254 family protein [Streptomyces mexicanus]|uniref:DUF2254 family protein n=1 Tax=Streptomyces mexicanus TaxID=178566 RepID=UPI001F2B61F9|nr:DUF2254 family protein [Streptomyces mexicanus]
MDQQAAARVRDGPSRTPQQNTAYGFRLLAGIANRALSPAVDDPATAVQALDRNEDALPRSADRSLGQGDALPSHGRARTCSPQRSRGTCAPGRHRGRRGGRPPGLRT